MTWIVDASVAVKWMVSEPLRDQARRLLNDIELLEAPDLLFPETANAIWRKVRLSEMSHAQAELALASIQRLVTTIHPSDILIQRAMAIAIALDHPVYDCCYLACAERRDGTLVTADERLCRAVTGSGFASLVRPLRDYRGVPPP